MTERYNPCGGKSLENPRVSPTLRPQTFVSLQDRLAFALVIKGGGKFDGESACKLGSLRKMFSELLSHAENVRIWGGNGNCVRREPGLRSLIKDGTFVYIEYLLARDRNFSKVSPSR